MIKDLLWFPTNMCLIDGAWVTPDSTNQIDLVNPSDGKILTSIAQSSKIDVGNAVSSAQSALKTSWGKKTAHERSQILLKMSKLVIKYGEKLAILEALDVGQPLSQAKNDVTALARYLEV